MFRKFPIMKPKLIAQKIKMVSLSGQEKCPKKPNCRSYILKTFVAYEMQPDIYV